MKDNPIEIPEKDRTRIEQDIRDIAGIIEEDAPVILDIESIRVTGDGKFELDLIKLFSRERPLVYKLEEGKYIIDIASTLKQSLKQNDEKNQ